MNSKPKPRKVVLVVGASSGFGKACAELLSAQEYSVFGTSRRALFGSKHPQSNLQHIPLDVCSDSAVDQAVQYVINEAGRIDVVINCAGIGYAGSVEDMTMEELRSQFETNFFGAVRVTKAVLPHMRKQRSGLFINISSIGGFMGLPFQSAYSASKFALEGFTESLRMETKPFGIHALILQPGDFKTGFTENRLNCEANQPVSEYFDACKRAIETTIAGELSGPSPDILAKRVLALIETRTPAVRYSTGPLMQRLAAKVKYWIPDRLFEHLIASEFKQR